MTDNISDQAELDLAGDGSGEIADQELEVAHVEESQEIIDIVSRVTDSSGDDAWACYERWRTILSKYQEESQLLDGLLEGIVSPLAGLLKAQAIGLRTSKGSERIRILGICRMLNVLVTVRGYKTVVKFFPHDAADLEAVLDALHLIRDEGAIAIEGQQQPSAEDSLAWWECQMMLLLWLSMLILIPFGLATVDTAQELANQQNAQRSKPYTLIVERILVMCKLYLHQPGGVREMAALLLGRLLTRPDMGPALQEFLGWAADQLSDISKLDVVSAPFLIPGILQTLALVFKLGKRTALLPHAARAWAQLSELHTKQVAGAQAVSGVLACKLTIKLTQRVALTFLTPRLAPWRYQKADAGSTVEVRLGQEALLSHDQRQDAPEGDVNIEQQDDGDEDEDFKLVEEIEEVIEVLLTALRDKDTVVRWSAAKGVGRVTGCLPKELGDEIVASVLTLFKPTESDTAWHGGCLALAELARRGLLLPERLSSLAPIIQQALLYDVRRGPHSIGAHVRDAGAYVCWAFARAYAPEVMESSVTVLASTLLTVACYDREVNCRRAAAAAFQESVGRLGNFPHGIDLLTIADYFNVGNINNAYTTVAISVAKFETYQLPLANHLLHVKLRHWEKSLRELAARALAALIPVMDQQYFADTALDALIPLCTNSVLETRNGAVVGIAELLTALTTAGIGISQDKQEQVANILPAIDKARLYRGKGGEVMREAVSKLVSAMAVAKLNLTPVQHTKVLEALDENLKHPQEVIQRAAVEGLRFYALTYLHNPEDQARFERYYEAFVTRLHDPNVAVRRGYALALGALPRHLLAAKSEEIIDALISGTEVEEDADERDTDSRVHCVKSLVSVCETLFLHAATSLHTTTDAANATQDLCKQAVECLQTKAIPCMHVCLRDYTIDNRGDVGSWVREAAMEGVVRLLTLLANLQQHAEQQQLTEEAKSITDVLTGAVPSAAAALVKQGLERIARMRESAMRCLRTLLSNPVLKSLLPAAEDVETAIPTDTEELTGIVSLEAVRKLAKLMALDVGYRSQALEGLVFSIGGMDAQLSKAASTTLLDVIEASVDRSSTQGSSNGNADTHLLQQIAEDFTALWQKFAKSSRMAVPLLRSADLLATRCEDICACMVPTQSAPAAKDQPTAAATGTPTQAAAHATTSSQRTFSEAIVEFARGETRQCTDVPRLLDAAGLLCHLISQTLACRTSAYQGLFVLLVNKYPKVRRHTAEALYLALLPMEPSEVGGCDEGVSSDTMEAVMDLLLTTPWDTSVDSAKSSRDLIASHLSVAVPAMKGASNANANRKPANDEYASYQSLLDDFARNV